MLLEKLFLESNEIVFKSSEVSSQGRINSITLNGGKTDLLRNRVTIYNILY